VAGQGGFFRLRQNSQLGAFMGVTSVLRQLIRIFGGKKQMKIASFLAMTTIFIAYGRIRGRQHKNGCHCEEERRGNLLHFYTRSNGCTQLLCFSEYRMSNAE
jgi:hypothetical protein